LACAGHGANLTIGNTISATGIYGTSIGVGSPVYVSSSGQLGTGTSSGIVTVDCSAIPPQSLQAAVNAARPGDTIKVTGTCNENVNIQEEKTRLTLDGQNVAVIHGPTPAGDPLFVRGRNILIQNFEITGGYIGIAVTWGSTAVINNNNIHDTASYGIVVVDSAFAVIKNNTIQNNPAGGIYVGETSTARIGFESTTDSAASPNSILNNGGTGIQIARGSSARIVSNTIDSNTGDGISVYRLSHADIDGNAIDDNTGNGINVNQNSSIQLAEPVVTNYLTQPNNTVVNNHSYGVRCASSSYVAGHTGGVSPVNGSLGQQSIDSSCFNNLVTP
jgi:parallel beta-helix repeat protein